MDGFNRVTLVGSLGADPELKYGANGSAFMEIRLATTESYVDANNQRRERTEWHRVKVFGKRAEGLAKVLGKGERIFVEGRIATREYEKDGRKVYITEIPADKVILLGSPGGRAQPRQQARYDADDDGRPGNDEPRFRRG